MALCPFTPLSTPIIHIINWSSDTSVLHEIIHMAQKTRFFNFDTEGDFVTKQAALIQIEFINPDQSTVVIIEACHLPWNNMSLKFWLIRSILRVILQSKNTIYMWGNAIQELSQFIGYGLLNLDQLKQPKIINVQEEFRRWHRDQLGFYAKGNNLWGLKAAIEDQFGEYLDKSLRLSRWSRSLTSTKRNYWIGNEKRQQMIEYCVKDCLAVTKLVHRMGLEVHTNKDFFVD